METPALETLPRSKNANGDVVVHPHEALQSIAVELHRSNAIAEAQYHISKRIAGALEAMVAHAEKGQGNVEAATGQSLAIVEKFLGPFFAKIGAPKDAPAPAAPSSLGEGQREREVPSQKTARLIAGVPARAVQVEAE